MEATTKENETTTTSVEVAIATAQPRNSGRHRFKFDHYDGDTENFYASETACVIFGVTIESATLSSSEILDAISSEQDRKVREYVEALIGESEHSDAHIEKISIEGGPHFQFAPMGLGKVYIAWNYLFTAYVTTYEHLKSAA